MFIVTFIKDNFACFADLFKFYSYTIYKTRILRLRPASTQNVKFGHRPIKGVHPCPKQSAMVRGYCHLLTDGYKQMKPQVFLV